MLKIYQITCYLFLPIILLNLYFRIIYNKEDKIRYSERFGRSNKYFKTSKKIIWLHAASIGEFKSCDLIISKYYLNFHILVTTTTKTSAEYINQFYSDKVIHQYIPFDVPLWCSRFINYWKPNLVLWIESDIWPNMLKEIKVKKIDCFYLNARISPKSYTKWKFLKNLYSSSLKTFNQIFAQSEKDLIRIKKLTNLKINYIGNLKLAKINNKLNYTNDNKAFSLMIASSHDNEESLILENIYKIIKNKKIKLYIGPRHLNRISEISKILTKHKLSFSLESELINDNNEVTIIDSFGNLEKYFKKCDIVILGGSFISKGGHNPIEPALHKCAIISGHFVYNWQNIYDEMQKEEACIIVRNLKELTNKIINLLENKIILENYKKKALDFSNKDFFDNETLFNEINLVLK